MVDLALVLHAYVPCIGRLCCYAESAFGQSFCALCALDACLNSIAMRGNAACMWPACNRYERQFQK
jgi:hypothetical protein